MTAIDISSTHSYKNNILFLVLLLINKGLRINKLSRKVRFLSAWVLLPIALFFVCALAVIVMICLPMYIAQHPSFGAPLNILIATIILCLMWFSFLSDGYIALAGFYDFEIILFKKTVPKMVRNPVWPMAFSYIYNTYTFAVIYAYISHIDPNSFGINKPLSTVNSIYFSVVTASTVGYGDIVPQSDAAKIIVMLQLFMNLTYVIFMFSLCSTHLKERRQHIRDNQNSGKN